MKNTENYGYTLKKLLCFTGIKFVVRDITIDNIKLIARIQFVNSH